MKTITKRLDPASRSNRARAFAGAGALALLALCGACASGGAHTARPAGTVGTPAAASTTAAGTPIRSTTNHAKNGAAGTDTRIYAQADTGNDAVPGDATARIEPDSMRMTSRMQGNVSIIEIFSPEPVGGVQLSAPPGGWPQTVQLRFHRMAAMQGFSARTKVAALRCDAATADAKDAPHLCMLGDRPVDAIKRSADGYEVELPGALLTAEDATMEVRWVDRYR